MCMYGQLLNNVTVFTTEMVKSDVDVMVSQTDHIKVNCYLLKPSLKKEEKKQAKFTSDSRT